MFLPRCTDVEFESVPYSITAVKCTEPTVQKDINNFKDGLMIFYPEEDKHERYEKYFALYKLLPYSDLIKL